MKKYFLSAVFILLLGCGMLAQQWMQYATPEDAGWSTELIEEAWEYADEIGSAAFMLIHDGKVVAQHGDITRRFMCHSVRKSLLSALYGIYVDNGTVDHDKTLAELGIDDVHHLTDQEKSATIRDMLKARSGVFHPAAYETESMKLSRPARGSHPPNTFWYYNNWDFNTLCAILMQHTGRDFFEDFKGKIADPIGMEDFRLSDTYYHLEAEHSRYPAYPFRMSARDLARIGQLFLQEGAWNGTQLISPSWIAESTTPYSYDTRRDGQGYAYMWWTGLYGDAHPNYSAQGVGNQAIIVFPEDNVVMVNRANTFKRQNVQGDDLRRLTEKLWAARTGPPASDPRLVPLQASSVDPSQSPIEMSRRDLDGYTGTFEMDGGATVVVNWHQGRLQIDTPFAGKYYLIPVGKDTFMAEDARYFLAFTREADGSLASVINLTR